MAIYSKKVLSHFQKPHNFGKIKNPDGVGEAGNIVCGDVMFLYIKVDKNKKGEEIIRDIKFETYGCVAAIATSSMITDLAKGKTVKEALAMQKETIVKSLDFLPPIKIHCSLLATDALKEAIFDYLTKQQKSIPEDLLQIHNRIIEHKNQIEERYKDWHEFEKDSS